jgi:hypothetical protein
MDTAITAADVILSKDKEVDLESGSGSKTATK